MAHARTPARILPVLAIILALAASGCAPLASRPTPPPPAEKTAASVSAVKSSGRLDVAEAQVAVLSYIDALGTQDATAAAGLMTSYRRAETRAKGWKAETGWWKSARVKAVMHPGRYLGDERAFAQLYAEEFGHPPYKLVVLNVSYGSGTDATPGDLDFVVTRDSAKAPWLVHDFGGAIRPDASAAQESSETP